MLSMLLEKYLGPLREIVGEHFEKKGRGRTCRGECAECVSTFAADVYEDLQEMWNMFRPRK